MYQTINDEAYNIASLIQTDDPEEMSRDCLTDIGYLLFEHLRPYWKQHVGVIPQLRDDLISASGISERREQSLLEPTRVLVITHDPTLTNLLKSVCITHGVQMVTSVLMSEEEVLNPDIDLTAFGLIVIDIAVFGGSEWHQKRLSCRLLRHWTEADPTLPLLFIGTASQKRAILAIRADTVRFLTRPINRHQLARTMASFERIKRHHPPPLSRISDVTAQEPIATFTNDL